MKKCRKNPRGITLIALVITIIVLLILAGISIQAITNTGIFAQAENAKRMSTSDFLRGNNIQAGSILE